MENIVVFILSNLRPRILRISAVCFLFRNFDKRSLTLISDWNVALIQFLKSDENFII